MICVLVQKNYKCSLGRKILQIINAQVVGSNRYIDAKLVR